MDNKNCKSINKHEMDLNSFVASIVKDVQDILRYKHYILDALSDSSNIFKFASDVIKEEGNHTESTSSQPLTCSAVRRQFKFAKKKIRYFVTWLQRHHQRVSWNKIIPALTWSIQAMALQDSVASEQLCSNFSRTEGMLAPYASHIRYIYIL